MCNISLITAMYTIFRPHIILLPRVDITPDVMKDLRFDALSGFFTVLPSTHTGLIQLSSAHQVWM
ncbi:uncharacterized protein MELLADRAFT_88864 [Melampsora larici-populina 98AG31]|uniref:Uncharacterized protein n=1 Tax=Melampsora larici-populina (strain 98AG31 / pathotype 3-4-7) TaxID=747676 RepID=F4RT90_MELLP|nr:uncharacterized protein MELLADRAFT_88864 [Melampsora larici-populina 98AG31]EGG04467.1 hypothetical protein MELLADRAFT_88864 [Melampsora larici-populina 98AG31]